MTRLNHSIAISALLFAPVFMFAQSAAPKTASAAESQNATAPAAATETATAKPASAAAAKDKDVKAKKKLDQQARLAEKLKLSGKQAKQFAAINEEFQKKNEALMESARALRQQVLDADEAGNTKRGDELAAQNAKVVAEIKAAKEARDEKLRSILTAEQLELWESASHRGGKKHAHAKTEQPTHQQ